MKQVTQIINEVKAGQFKELLKDIYVDESMIAYQEERYVKAMESYVNLYGEQEVEIYSAAGRSEVGGNHTDHQQGQVLAAAVNLDAIAMVRKTEEPVVTTGKQTSELVFTFTVTTLSQQNHGQKTHISDESSSPLYGSHFIGICEYR